MFADIKKLFSYRELLFSLTKKELKVKYRGSVLGFFWSLLNPILTMLVYSFVFSIVLRAGIQQFAIFLICALLPFNFLSNQVFNDNDQLQMVRRQNSDCRSWFPSLASPSSSKGISLTDPGYNLLLVR